VVHLAAAVVVMEVEAMVAVMEAAPTEEELPVATAVLMDVLAE
jgi:hypothetical protein